MDVSFGEGYRIIDVGCDRFMMVLRDVDFLFDGGRWCSVDVYFVYWLSPRLCFFEVSTRVRGLSVFLARCMVHFGRG